MNITSKIVLAAIVGIVVGAGGAMAFTKTDRIAEKSGMEHMMPNGEAMGGSMMHNSMNDMMASLQGKTGDVFDHAFLKEMTIHHEGAVAMAQMALQSAKHQEIKDLAQNIITAQNKEIAEMNSWKQQWYASTTSSH